MQDNDMKIAPSNLSTSLKKNSSYEGDSVKEYIFHRKLGNIAVAHKLGQTLAKDIDGSVWTEPPIGVDKALFEDQLMVLFCYVVSRVVETRSPCSTLGHTVLGRFYDELEQYNEEFFGRFADSGAFSLYLYLNRMHAETPHAIGTIFASQCTTQNIDECSDLGSRSYTRFWDTCLERLSKAGYATE